MFGTPEWFAWQSMLQRCRNPNAKAYPNYGGRGILVCDRWLSFEGFIADMGKRPGHEHSIDRIDVNGNYEPGNCRWATRAQQARNKRCTVLEEHEPAQIRWLVNECGYTQADVCRFFGLKAPTVCVVVNKKAWT